MFCVLSSFSRLHAKEKYLLGGVACTEKHFTAFPAALERRKVGTGVVVDQVLLQMLHQPEDQRTAVPLETQDAVNHSESDKQMCKCAG